MSGSAFKSLYFSTAFYSETRVAASHQSFHHNLMLLLNTVISSQTPPGDMRPKTP